MAGPKIVNRTPFHVSDLYGLDEDGRPVLTLLTRGTYHIDGAAGTVELNDVQVPAKLAGEFNYDAEASSYRYEPEMAFIKLATDVVLIGHAHAPNGRAVVVDVGLKVGGIQKIVRVHGDRYWVKTGRQIVRSQARPFARMPLVYERAFGGWDKGHRDPANWTFDPRNPVGVGFGDPLKFVEEGKVRMPNLEDPQHAVERYGDVGAVAGFGFVSPNWQSRAKYAGTYDSAWEQRRKPWLPQDFDRRFFNGASPGLVASSFMRGDEEVVIVNAAPISPLRFSLPGLRSPTYTVRLRDGELAVARSNLDTVILNTDDMLVFLLWRSYIELPTGPHDVGTIEVRIQEATR